MNDICAHVHPFKNHSRDQRQLSCIDGDCSRQVGKTTLLEICVKAATPAQQRADVTLDDMDARALARRDPALFLKNLAAAVDHCRGPVCARAVQRDQDHGGSGQAQRYVLAYGVRKVRVDSPPLPPSWTATSGPAPGDWGGAWDCLRGSSGQPSKKRGCPMAKCWIITEKPLKRRNRATVLLFF